ncbi:MAG: hypothetical protein H6738_09050 [Alphaproteobacteria bacterium]|nr:hypothetical protein [Alphaproteobacteria bacterium]
MLVLALAQAGCSGVTCESPVAGTWTLQAPRIDHDLDAELGPSTEGECWRSLTGWSDETVPSLPDRLLVKDTDVILVSDDDPYWVSCVGELSEDLRTVDGACFADEPFTLTATGR